MELQNLLGTIQTGTIKQHQSNETLVAVAEHTFHLLEKTSTGDVKVQGFLYENQHHQYCITTKIPQATVGRYGFGTVSKVRGDLGVFVNIGLPDKDIVVSLDDLPELKSLWPQIGDRLLIRIIVDHKSRLWGKLADSTIYKQLARPVTPQLQNQNVQATVYRLKLNGTYVLTNDYHLGFIHPSEREREPHLGEVVAARVIGVSFDHVNLSLKPRAYEEISDDAAMILAVLQHQPQHQINFNDKSDPQAIKNYFGISKSSFKRALGNLLKRRLIIQTAEGIQLCETDD